MHVQLEQVSDLASALQRQVEIQAEAAKQAIHELQEIDSPGSFSSAMDALSLNCLEVSDWLSCIEERDNKSGVEFDHCWEEEVAAMLDENRISWRYKPRTFAVEWDEEGNFVDSFTPGFYLPAFDLYVEVAATDYRASGTKARKVRLLRQQHPEIRIEFRNADRLAQLLVTFF